MAKDYRVKLKATDDTKAAFDSAKKNGRELDKTISGIRTKANEMGKALLGSAAAGTAAIGYLTKQTVDYANEVQRLSDVSSSSTDEFQKRAVGARLLGIEQEKLADIFKDTNDKIGDFLQTGGGPLKDFFENIAPQVGVTAEQFKNLSGGDALELYVSSLEQANVSQNEMTFYLEAIASDATRLLPLLRNNGEGFKALGSAADEAGAIMSDKTLAAAQELNAVLFDISLTGEGFKNQVREGTLPVITDLAEQFSQLSNNSSLADGSIDLLNGTMKFTASGAVGAFATIQLLGKAIGGLGAAAAAADSDGSFLNDFLKSPLFALGNLAKDAYDNSDKVKQALEVSGDDLQQTVDEYATILSGISTAGNTPEDKKARSDRLAAIVEFQEKAREALGLNSGKGSKNPLVDPVETDKAKASLTGLLQSLEQQVQTFDESQTAVLKYRLTMGDLSDEVKALGDEGQRLVKVILSESEVLEAQNEQKKAAAEAERQLTQQKQQAAQIIQSVLTPQEAYIKQLEKIDALTDVGALDLEYAKKARAQAFEQLQQTKDNLDEVSEYAKQAARNMQDAFADFLFDPFEDGLDGMLKGFIDVLRRSAAEAAASQIFDAVGSGLEGTSFGNFFGDLLSFDGGGFTGHGSRTGGVDGRGGYPAILHPNETVIDHTKTISQNQGNVSVNVNVDARGSEVSGDDGRSRQLGSLIANTVKSVLIDERRPGGLLGK